MARTADMGAYAALQHPGTLLRVHMFLALAALWVLPPTTTPDREPDPVASPGCTDPAVAELMVYAARKRMMATAMLRIAHKTLEEKSDVLKEGAEWDAPETRVHAHTLETRLLRVMPTGAAPLEAQHLELAQREYRRHFQEPRMMVMRLAQETVNAAQKQTWTPSEKGDMAVLRIREVEARWLIALAAQEEEYGLRLLDALRPRCQ